MLLFKTNLFLSSRATEDGDGSTKDPAASPRTQLGEEDFARDGLTSAGAELQAPPSGVDRDDGPDATSRTTSGADAVNEKNGASSRATLNGDEIPEVHVTTSRATQGESRI